MMCILIRSYTGLLAVQLAITTVIGGAIVFTPSVKALLIANPSIMALSLVASLVIMLTFIFSESARHSHPTNLILLFSFTVAEGILVGAASSQYSTDLVVTAFAMTAAVSTGLTIYAMRTKQDFTYLGGFLHSMLITLVLAGFMGAIFRVPIFNLSCSVGGAGLFCIYLIYDVQVLMGGQHQHKISPDEYVFGAISIYLDIINL